MVEPPCWTPTAPQVVVEGPADADGVDAAVLVEVAVLGGQHRLLQHGGDLVERDVDAVLLGAERGDGVVRAARLGDVGRAHERRLEQGLLRRQVDVEHDGRDTAGAGDDPPAPTMKRPRRQRQRKLRSLPGRGRRGGGTGAVGRWEGERRGLIGKARRAARPLRSGRQPMARTGRSLVGSAAERSARTEQEGAGQVVPGAGRAHLDHVGGELRRGPWRAWPARPSW